MKYRPEIDGLRAIAVILVVLFHVGFKALDGGFIGVDIFIVISGYLIVTKVELEIENKTFSIFRFYEKRARRLLPGLIVVLFVSSLLAWVLFLAEDMYDYSQSLIASITFSSNIYFSYGRGYWDAPIELNPLLHTWSLAVEGQFYILLPILFILIHRHFKPYLYKILLAISICSFLISNLGVYYYPIANYFLLPSRLWEFSIGIFLANYLNETNQSFIRVENYPRAKEILTFTGLVMIGWSVWLFDDSIPYPSFYTLLPTLGTAFIIISSDKSRVGNILKLNTLVKIGLVSYGFYLWHYPTFAFFKYLFPSNQSSLSLLALIVFSYLLAYLSWRYVETPFTHKINVVSNRVLKLGGLTSIIFIGVGVTGIVTNGFENRRVKSGQTLSSIEERLTPNYGLDISCEYIFTLSPNCRTSEMPEILIWGDSFAMHLVPGVMSSNTHAEIIQMTKSLCAPFFDTAVIEEHHSSVQWAEGCLTFNEEVKIWLEANETVKYVVLSSPFDKYLNDENSLLLRSGDIIQPTIDIVYSEFENTLLDLQKMGIKPIIFAPPPTNSNHHARCIVLALRIGSSLENCNFSISGERGDDDVDIFLEKVSAKFPVVFFEDLICTRDSCQTFPDSIFTYRDTGHLSREGSAMLGEKYDFYSLIINQN